MGTEDDYDKAKQYLDENKQTSVGTLSKSEWDVASKNCLQTTIIEKSK